MKYLFLNHFAFENIDSSINQKDIIELFTSLAQLTKVITELKCNLIFDNKLASSMNYIKLIDDRATKIFLLTKIQHSRPFCSDSFDEYFEDENIVLGNCVIDGTDIDILENFLACAVYLHSPIVTPRSICKNSCFLNETINIKCNNESIELKNYFLEKNETSGDKNFNQKIIEDIKIYIDNLDLGITQDNFWDRKEDFFPDKIIFCKEVEKQIKKIDKRIFQQAINILRDIETNKKLVTDYNHSGESQSVKEDNELKKLRYFTVSNEKVYFDNHIKSLSNANRIYFLEQDDKIYIGYIGKHLGTKKFK